MCVFRTLKVYWYASAVNIPTVSCIAFTSQLAYHYNIICTEIERGSLDCFSSSVRVCYKNK